MRRAWNGERKKRPVDRCLSGVKESVGRRAEDWNRSQWRESGRTYKGEEACVGSRPEDAGG